MTPFFVSVFGPSLLIQPTASGAVVLNKSSQGCEKEKKLTMGGHVSHYICNSIAIISIALKL